MRTKSFFKAIDILMDYAQNGNVPIKTECVRTLKDLRYDLDAPCSADVYFTDRVAPIIVYIHGGGFVAGGKEYRRGISSYLAACGYTVVTPDYGLCPDYTFPSSIVHLVKAMKWIKSQSKTVNGDIHRIAVMGDSAGAYYAAMLCAATFNNSLQEVVGNPDITFDCAIFNCGVFDVKSLSVNKLLVGLDKKLVKEMTGADLDNFDSYKYSELCSPVNLVTTDHPRAFFIYSKADIFCANQSESMMRKLSSLGIPYESYCSESPLRNHCFSLEWRSREAKEANTLMMRFLRKYLMHEQE